MDKEAVKRDLGVDFRFGLGGCITEEEDNEEEEGGEDPPVVVFPVPFCTFLVEGTAGTLSVGAEVVVFEEEKMEEEEEEEEAEEANIEVDDEEEANNGEGVEGNGLANTLV